MTPSAKREFASVHEAFQAVVPGFVPENVVEQFVESPEQTGVRVAGEVVADFGRTLGRAKPLATKK